MSFNIKEFINEMKPFVSQSYGSHHDIVDGLFYQPGKKDFDWSFGTLNESGNKLLEKLHKEFDFPKELVYAYLGLNTENDELVYNNYTFLSLTNISKELDRQKKYGQNKFVDIGMRYAGMGHCFVLSWHKIERKFFIRLDGGANGYDVQYNHTKFIENDIDFSDDKEKLMNWKELTNFLTAATEDSFFSRCLR
jgi:hypothetical protein